MKGFTDTITVAESGANYADLSDAVDAASAGDTILVYPGTYTDSITIAVNNLSIIGMGAPFNTTLTQADANLIDFGATTGGRIVNFTLNLSAPTTAINAIQGSTGNFQVKMCRSILTTAAALNQADQPRVGEVTGAGTLFFSLGKVSYNHSGVCTTDTAIKAPFEVATGGVIKAYTLNDIDINGSGSALATAVGLSAGTGYISVHSSIIDVDDDTTTLTVGLGYLSSATSILNEFSHNEIHVHGNANNAYGVYATNSTVRSSHNHIHVECAGAGAAYSFVENGTGEINSHMDDIIATGGYTGNGVNIDSSDADGDHNTSGDMTVGGAISGTGVLTVSPDGTNEVFQVNDGTIDFTDGDAGTIGVLTIASDGDWSYSKEIAASVVTTSASATPGITFVDNNTTDKDDSAIMYANATDTATTTEDIDVYIRQQVAGTMTTTIFIDADGNLELGTSAQPVEIKGPLVYATTTVTAAGPSDDIDVSGVNVVFIDASGATVTIGGFVGGVSGQVIRVVRLGTANDAVLENNEGGGNQDIFLADEGDQTIATYGGWTLVCNGTDWFEAGY